MNSVFPAYYSNKGNTITVKCVLLKSQRSNYLFHTDISCLRGVFAKKYQSRDDKFPDPNGEGNLVSRLVFFEGNFSSRDWYFSQIPLPNMIYLFNYTEYYLEHWLSI